MIASHPWIADPQPPAPLAYRFSDEDGYKEIRFDSRLLKRE